MDVLVTDKSQGISRITAVATRRKPSGPLYLAQWFDHSGIDDAAIAEHMNVARETVWRWRVGDRVPKHPTLRRLAALFKIEPEQFWQSPSRPSLDALAKNTSDEEYTKIFNVVSLLTGQSGKSS